MCKAAFGYVPKGLQELSGIFSAPLAGYNMPLPFFSGANAPLWHTAIGYEISGIVGILAAGRAGAGAWRRCSARRDGRAGARPSEAHPSA